MAELIKMLQAQPVQLAVRHRHDIGIAGLAVEKGHLAHDVPGRELGQFDALAAYRCLAVPEKIQAIARFLRADKCLPGRDLAIR